MSTLSISPVQRRLLAVLPSMAIIGIFLIIPLGFVVVYSFMESDPYGGVEAAFSTDAYVKFLFERSLTDEMVFNPTYLIIFARSIAVAGVATLLCILIGFPVAYYMALQPAHRQTLLVFLVTIPFWTNLLIRTYCWILLLRDGGVINSLLIGSGLISSPITLLYTDFAIMLGLVYMYIPFMILPIYASLSRLNLSLVEAAHDLYAKRWDVLRQVIVPLAMPGILAGSVLVFIPSIGNFIAPELLGGGQNLMIGNLIQLQFSSARDWPFGSASALILLASVLLVLIFIARGSTRKAMQQGMG